MTGSSLPKRYLLSTKFNLLTVGLILVTSAGICLYLVGLEIQHYRNDLLNHGRTIAETLGKNCELGVYTEDRKMLLPVLNSLSADDDIAYVSVSNRERKPLAARDFRIAPGRAGHLVPTAGSLRGDPVRDLADPLNKRRYIEILHPIMSESSGPLTDAVLRNGGRDAAPAVIGYIRLGLTLDSLNSRVNQLVVSTVFFASLIVLVGTALTLLMTRRITAPLKRLTRATQDISEGRFDTPISIRTTDEICDLAESFDRMRSRLRTYHAEVETRIARERQHVVEKEKIVMDLHDGVGGITSNIRILAEMAQRTDDLEDIRRKLGTISQLSQEGALEIRSLMQSIDTREMTWQVMAAYVRNMGSTLLDPHRIGFVVDARLQEVSELPSSTVWVNVFKIYKEALTNVIKHARAESVSVALQVSEQGFTMTVRDNGVGYDGIENQGRGQSIMRKRAREVGGVVAVSLLEKGTEVSLQIPFPITWHDLKTHY
ncbi:MAG: HAMP domain-containing protein [Nitrospirota bacterium]|nr:HAMP domain-containing protein [Nitrospirota bacterium]